MKTLYAFPDEIWHLVKEYQGFQKYYIVPARKNKTVNRTHNMYINEMCLNKLTKIMSETQNLPSCLLQALVFFIHYNEWIQCVRTRFRSWDRLAYSIAERCNNYLNWIHCECGVCDRCMSYRMLNVLSKQFYAKYVL